MKVFLWFTANDKHGWWYNIVLWDGENTYWTEEMQSSGGYKKKPRSRLCKITNSKFIYLGDL